MGGIGEHAGSGRRGRAEDARDLSRRRLTRGPLLVARLGRVVAALECAAVLPRAGDPGAGPCHVDLEWRLKAWRPPPAKGAWRALPVTGPPNVHWSSALSNA